MSKNAVLRLFRAAAALLVAGLALNLQPPVKEAGFTPMPRAYQAFAQNVREVRICGGCYCYDGARREQCEADNKAAYERANPPRGDILGVCYASYIKWENNPETGQQVLRTQSAVYTRVRYNETRVDGFIEVSAAWTEFLRVNYQPPQDGWRWANTCSALSKARNPREIEYWTKAQAQASYKRVFMPTYGIADTPAERELERQAEAVRRAGEAERARQAEASRRAAEARAAEQARRQAAAEAARRAEVARVEAERQRRIDAIASQIGPGKRAEAERLSRMNEELRALRPKPKQPPRQCTSRRFATPVSFTASTEAVARAGLRGTCNIGGSETVTSVNLGLASCAPRNAIQIKPPPVGKCLSCIDERMAINMYGYVPGRGYPPPQVEWRCTATAQCVAERCGDGTSPKVSEQ